MVKRLVTVPPSACFSHHRLLASLNTGGGVMFKGGNSSIFFWVPGAGPPRELWDLHEAADAMRRAPRG